MPESGKRKRKGTRKRGKKKEKRKKKKKVINRILRKKGLLYIVFLSFQTDSKTKEKSRSLMFLSFMLSIYNEKIMYDTICCISY